MRSKKCPSQGKSVKGFKGANMFFLMVYRVITKKSVNSVMNERQLLSQIKHP